MVGGTSILNNSRSLLDLSQRFQYAYLNEPWALAKGSRYFALLANGGSPMLTAFVGGSSPILTAFTNGSSPFNGVY